MKTIRIAAALALLSACSPGSDGSANRSTPTGLVKRDGREPAVQATPVSAAGNGLGLGYPTSQPDGSPLTVAYCLRVGEEPNSPFDNAKTCFMVGCEQGDRASCDMAETYNGNLRQD
jgi:hypothetical protein